MRKICTLLSVFLIVTSYAQKIKTSNMVYNLSNEERYIYLDEYESSNPFLYQFGDGNEMLSKDNTRKGRIVKHKYSSPGNYVVKVFELKDGKQILVTAENITIIPPPEKISFTGVSITKYNPVKSDGRAWDNMMGGTYPDIYILYYSGDRMISKGSIAYDVNPNNLPVILDKGKQFNISEFPENLTIYFYDYDSVTGADFMAGFNFNLDPLNLIENESQGITFSHDGFEGVIDYKIN